MENPFNMENIIPKKIREIDIVFTCWVMDEAETAAAVGGTLS